MRIQKRAENQDEQKPVKKNKQSKNLEFNVYKGNGRLVATIFKRNEDYKIELKTNKQSDLPVLLQGNDLCSNNLVYFLKHRVLPTSRDYVTEQMKQRGINTWIDQIKLNSGRVLTDDFYILTVENGVETKKSKKSSISEVEITGEDDIWNQI